MLKLSEKNGKDCKKKKKKKTNKAKVSLLKFGVEGDK